MATSAPRLRKISASRSGIRVQSEGNASAARVTGWDEVPILKRPKLTPYTEPTPVVDVPEVPPGAVVLPGHASRVISVADWAAYLRTASVEYFTADEWNEWAQANSLGTGAIQIEQAKRELEQTDNQLAAWMERNARRAAVIVQTQLKRKADDSRPRLSRMTVSR